MVLWKNFRNFLFVDRVSELPEISEVSEYENNIFSDPKSGHYPGAVNIPFPSLFNPDTRTLKTVDELKKGRLFTIQGAHSRILTKPRYSWWNSSSRRVVTATLFCRKQSSASHFLHVKKTFTEYKHPATTARFLWLICGQNNRFPPVKS